MTQMTKSDRSELKQILVRRSKQFKADAQARIAEMRAESVSVLNDGYEAENFARDELDRALRRIAEDATKQGQDLVDEHRGKWPHSPVNWRGFGHMGPTYDDRLRRNRRQQVDLELDVLYRNAVERIERVETDLRETLLRETLDTDHGHAFLDKIPTVGELIPKSRVDEILAASAEELEA